MSQIIEGTEEKILLPIVARQVYDCFDSIIVSVFEYLNWSYELLFFDEWKFNFIYEKYTRDHKLSDNLKTKRNHRWDYLEEYHGIQLDNVEVKQCKDLKERIRQSLLLNKPVLACFDAYYCPWIKEYYLRITDFHEVIIVGITADSYIIKDFQYAVNGIEIPYKEFEKSATTCRVLIKKETDKKFDWKMKVKEMSINLLSSNMFSEILQFADALSNEEDLIKEIDGNKGPIYAKPLLEDIHYIGMTREQVAASLLFLYQENNIPSLKEIVENLKMVGLKWASVFGMICKVFCIKEERRSFIIKRIVMKIKEIALDEEKIVNELLFIASEDKATQKEKLYSKTSVNNEEISIFEQVDLSEYLNTNGAADCISYDCTSVFTSDARYMYITAVDIEKLSNINHIPFRVGHILQENNDHISCYGERIGIEKGKYKRIYFLCCSDLESQCEKLMVEYADGAKDDVKFNVSAWLRKPRFNEEIAAECHVVAKDNEQREAFTYPFSSYIFFQSVEIDGTKECCTVELPTCPNIHIFAITLAR